MKLEELVGKKLTEEQFDEAAGKKDACYHKVKARYDVWPSAYASGALVKCRKVGAKNWGNKSKKEGVNEAGMELNKLKDAIKMFQKKIEKQGRVTNARDEEHLSNLIKLYNQMGGKGIKEAGFPAKLSPPSKPKVKKAQKVWMKKYMNPKGGPNVIKLKKDGQPPFPTNKNYDKLIKKFPFLKEGVNEQDVFMESIAKDGITETHIYWESDGKPHGYTFNFVNELNEAEYQGRKVKLGKVMQGDTKKFKVYVKNPKGNVVKVNFGQGGDAKGGTMRIRKSNPAARKSFRARHNCDNPGPRHKARYWSCKKW